MKNILLFILLSTIALQGCTGKLESKSTSQPSSTSVVATHENQGALLEDGDTCFFPNDGKLVILNGTEKKEVSIGTDTRQLLNNQIFMPDINNVIYNTNFNGVLGQLKTYNIEKNKTQDVLKKFNINLPQNTHIYKISYSGKYIIAQLGKTSEKNSSLPLSKLLIINYELGKYKFINPTVFPNSFCVFKDGSFIIFNSELVGEKNQYRLLKYDPNGKLINKLSTTDFETLNNGVDIVWMSVFPNSDKVLFLNGSTPEDIHFYNLNTGKISSIGKNALNFCSFGLNNLYYTEFNNNILNVCKYPYDDTKKSTPH